jgi:hypothetical protein
MRAIADWTDLPSARLLSFSLTGPVGIGTVVLLLVSGARAGHLSGRITTFGAAIAGLLLVSSLMAAVWVGQTTEGWDQFWRQVLTIKDGIAWAMTIVLVIIFFRRDSIMKSAISTGGQEKQTEIT